MHWQTGVRIDGRRQRLSLPGNGGVPGKRLDDRASEPSLPGRYQPATQGRGRQIVSAIDIVRQWIATVNEQLGTSIELTDGGACAIEFEDGATLFIQVLPEEESVVLYAPLAALDVRPGALYLLGVLGLNLFNRSTGAGVIGYDAERHTLVYSERIDIARSDALSFASRLDEFPTVRVRLQQALSEVEAQATRAVDNNAEFLRAPIEPRFLTS
jgi:Tir chaperone protein (CesT) family